MTAVRENKSYKITVTQKQSYLDRGYDIYDEKGKLIESPKSKTVPQAQYDKLKAEHEKALKELQVKK